MEAGVNRFSENVDLLLARLRIAAVADKKTERRIRILLVLTIVTVIAAIGACNNTFFSETPSLPRPVGVAVLSVLTVAAVILGRWWSRSRLLDLDDRKLQTLQKLLGILRADIPKQATIIVAVDFRDYKTAGATRRKGAVTVYRDAWLDLAVPLADGNVLTLAVTDRVKRKAKRKRTAEQFRTDVDLGLRLNKRYDDAAEIVRRLRRVAAPKPFGAMTVSEGRKTDGRQKRLWARLSTPLAVNSSGLVGGDGLLAAVRWTYAGLAPPRAG